MIMYTYNYDSICIQVRVLRQSFTGACPTTCSDLSSPVEGVLKVHVLRAHSLPDTDGTFQGRSDPFAIVSAFRFFGSSSVSKSTAVIQGTHDPVFDETLNFGCDKWRSISIGVLDSDCGRDEVLVPFESFPICSSGRCSVQHVSGSSWLNFDIEVIPVNNGC